MLHMAVQARAKRMGDMAGVVSAPRLTGQVKGPDSCGTHAAHGCTSNGEEGAVLRRGPIARAPLLLQITAKRSRPRIRESSGDEPHAEGTA